MDLVGKPDTPRKIEKSEAGQADPRARGAHPPSRPSYYVLDDPSSDAAYDKFSGSSRSSNRVSRAQNSAILRANESAAKPATSSRRCSIAAMLSLPTRWPRASSPTSREAAIGSWIAPPTRARVFSRSSVRRAFAHLTMGRSSHLRLRPAATARRARTSSRNVKTIPLGSACLETQSPPS